MTIQIRLFAILRERAGAERVELELPAHATVADAITALARVPGLDALSGAGGAGVRIAVNREYADALTPIRAGDELAAIPPVSGGDPTDQEITAAGDTYRACVTRAPLRHDPLIAFVIDQQAGGLVTFAGYPRDVPQLEYEAYAEMALERMVAILQAAGRDHGLTRMAAEHRTGSVPAGEPSILIAVSAPHRAEAFAGARDILDRIKAEAPIWKVEVDAAGGRTRPEGALPE